MKKFVIISIGLVVILVTLIIVLNANNHSQATTTGVDNIPVSTQSTIESQFSQGKTFLLVIGESTCSHCQDYKATTLNQYLGNELVPLYFTYSDTGFPNSTDFETFLHNHNLTYNASPTSYIIKNGTVVASLEGDIALSKLTSFINSNLS